MSDNKMNRKDLVISAVVGGILGAMTALLLAPKPGKELREDLTGHYREVSEKTHELASIVSQKTQEAAKQISTVTTELAVIVKKLAASAKDEIQSKREARKESGDSVEEATASEEAVAVAEVNSEEEPLKS